MAQAKDLNISPYYDDFDPSNNFYKWIGFIGCAQCVNSFNAMIFWKNIFESIKY